MNGPVELLPQFGFPRNVVLTNLQPGPKFNPLGNVFCKSHNQYLDWDPPPKGEIIGCRLVHPGPRFI